METGWDFEKIDQVIRRHMAECRPWNGIVYRSVSLRFFNQKAIVSGEGSAIYGGRWSPKGARAVYGSLSPEIAMAETVRRYRYAGVPVEKAMPKVFVAVEVSLSQSLDLTESDILRELGIVVESLATVDWMARQERGEEILTQVIGQAVAASKIEAMFVPSLTDRTGTNVVIFPEALRPGSTIHVRDV